MKEYTPETLATLATSIALALAKDKTPKEIAVVQCVLIQINTTLSTICGQKNLLENYKDNKKTP